MIMLAFFKLMLNSRRWEDRFGAINGIIAMNETNQSTATSQEMDEFLWKTILLDRFPEMLVDAEFRVRN